MERAFAWVDAGIISEGREKCVEGRKASWEQDRESDREK